MALEKELTDFLAGARRRAFRQAAYAVRRDEAALDIVQDAMIKLAERYRERPAAEFPFLFQRILRNTILDFFRREAVRNTWLAQFSAPVPERSGDDEFGLEAAEAGAQDPALELVERMQVIAAIEAELEKLPQRQRDAFLMRYWQDMGVADTAQAMGCSEGSVKTHCWRATQALARGLKERGFE